MRKGFLKLFLKNLYEDRYNCICCSEEYPGSEYGLCDKCFKNVLLNDGAVCVRCGGPIKGGDGSPSVCGNCSGKTRSFDSGIVSLVYDGDVKKMILKYKFYNGAYMGKYLASFIRDKINSENLSFDVIAYVPLTDKKKKQRGYDQAELLAKKVAFDLNKPLFTGLKRNSEALEQHDLSRSEREKNAQKLFFTSGGKEEIKNKTVLLVDDIITTGSTLDAAAACLKKLGAKKIIIAPLAGAEYKADFEKENLE